ncbi:MAG: cation diffusion facilitator family transporter [Gemmatimonadota bacterium]|nr:cation diffusion facilitator family transporter [Gemmatimonadota bacterium]
MRTPTSRAMRAAQVGMLVNLVLAVIKLIAGIVGHAYALVADAVESTADIFSSLVVYGGLRIAAQPADENHPYGHGRAEALAGALVAVMLSIAAVGIAIEAIREIRTPHHVPHAWTLGVLVGVIIIKQFLAKRVFQIGSETGSTAVMADAQHHRSDVITSTAAFIGISIAVIGGPGWEQADDWAALVASVVILYNGMRMLRPAINDLMDRVPDAGVIDGIALAALGVADVCAIEKLKVRKVGLQFAVDLHVQADPNMSLHDAHVVSGKVKGAIRLAMPAVDAVLVHMEPYEP